MSASEPGLQFNFEWRITLFTVLMFPLLVWLGFWQLDRAEEKQGLAVAFEQQQAQPPAPLAALWEEPAQQLGYRAVELVGEYQEDAYFLLDNKIRGGQFGYEVLHVFRMSDGDAVLVNRGWVAGDSSRQRLPEVPRVSSNQDSALQVTGHIYIAPGKPYLLASQQIQAGWPKRVQAVEMDKLSPPVTQLLGGEVFPYPVRIDANARGALAVDWQVINMSPDKHLGYAVQWFTMAAVLLLLYLFQSSNLKQWVFRSRKTPN